MTHTPTKTPIPLGKRRHTPKKRKLTLNPHNAIYPNGRTHFENYQMAMKHSQVGDSRTPHDEVEPPPWDERQQLRWMASLSAGQRAGMKWAKNTEENYFLENLYKEDPDIEKFLMDMNYIENQNAVKRVNTAIKNINNP